MTEFYPGDMVEVMERGKVRVIGQVRMRSRWEKDNEPCYLILPEGEKSLAHAIAAFHDQIRPSLALQIANENHRAAASLM